MMGELEEFLAVEVAVAEAVVAVLVGMVVEVKLGCGLYEWINFKEPGKC